MLQLFRIRMGQGSKNKTAFKLPVEITTVIGWISAWCISFFILLFDILTRYITLCLLLQLKSGSARGWASRHPAFMGNWPTIIHKCLLILPRRWVPLFVPVVPSPQTYTAMNNEQWITIFFYKIYIFHFTNLYRYAI